MEVYRNGKLEVLTQNEFVAKGGEGQVFKKNGIAYKIYHKVSQMIHPAKIKELATMNHSQILSPIDILLNKKKQNIGFTMGWIDNTVVLVKLFTNTFRQNNGIENDMVIELVEGIKNLTQFVHDHKCLIIDHNELNCLVIDKEFTKPYFIDVNAWQTPSFPATVIMPSIRDWTATSFTPLTDWFSFGIIAFQLFVGIHPFKGGHKGYRRNDFEKRVQDHISVFNSQVTLPPTTRDFNLIPSAYKDWFYKVFENGDRLLPPTAPGFAEKVQVIVKLIQSTNSFEIKHILEVAEKILYHNPENNVTKTKNKIYIGRTDYNVNSGVEVLFTPLEKIPVLVKIENDLAEFKLLNNNYNLKTVAITATDMMIINDTLYLKNRSNLLEIDFKVLNDNFFVNIKTTWKIELLSSVLYSSVVYQNILGKSYLGIPKPNPSGKSSFYSVAIPELDDFRVIEAKYQNQVCMLVGEHKNEYHRIVLIFDDHFKTYRCRIVGPVDYMPLNFVVLDNTVCINITEDNAVEIFRNKIDKPDIKRIEDPDINNNMRLCKDGTFVKFWRDNKVYSMTMK